MRKAIGSFLIAIMITGGTAVAGPQWYRYHTPDGGPVITVKARCVSAEDSAAHLRLVDYSADRITYGCAKGGF